MAQWFVVVDIYMMHTTRTQVSVCHEGDGAARHMHENKRHTTPPNSLPSNRGGAVANNSARGAHATQQCTARSHVRDEAQMDGSKGGSRFGGGGVLTATLCILETHTHTPLPADDTCHRSPTKGRKQARRSDMCACAVLSCSVQYACSEGGFHTLHTKHVQQNSRELATTTRASEPSQPHVAPNMHRQRNVSLLAVEPPCPPNTPKHDLSGFPFLPPANTAHAPKTGRAEVPPCLVSFLVFAFPARGHTACRCV